MSFHDVLNTTELAKIVGDLTGDGHLQIRNKKYVASFYSKDLDEIKRMKKFFMKLFDIKGKIHTDKRPVKNNNKVIRYKIYFPSKKVCLFLKKVGVPTGNKTNNPFLIPSWITNGRNELKKAYLKALFDNEATIFCEKKTKRWQIGFRMVKNENILNEGLVYFNQIKEILKEFNIYSSPIRSYKCNLRKDGSQSYDMYFRIEKSSFKDFYENIGFDHPLKKKKLKLALSS